MSRYKFQVEIVTVNFLARKFKFSMNFLETTETIKEGSSGKSPKFRKSSGLVVGIVDEHDSQF